jgi:hypothetical protein
MQWLKGLGPQCMPTPFYFVLLAPQIGCKIGVIQITNPTKFEFEIFADK